MNVNVIVMNIYNDFRPSDVANHPKDRDERFANAPSNSRAAAEKRVIELVSEDGKWIGKGGAKASHYRTHDREALLATSGVMTYDRGGKALYSPQDKGLHLNIIA